MPYPVGVRLARENEGEKIMGEGEIAGVVVSVEDSLYHTALDGGHCLLAS